MTRLVALLCVFGVLDMLAGCGESGRLLISLERPVDEALDPMQDERLSKFNLRIIQEGVPKDQETFRTADRDLVVGSVPVAEPFDLRLAGKSSTGQMLGLGMVFGIEVPEQEETEVAIKFRKPIGYVAGTNGLERLDATASTRAEVNLPPLASNAKSVDVAASPDGGWLLVLTGPSLEVYRTSDQQKWAAVGLEQQGTCLAVSPTNEYAVVCHEEDKKLSVVDLIQLAEQGSTVPGSIALDERPTRVVFGQQGDRAWVLVNGVDEMDGCSTNSGVTEVDLRSGTKVRGLAVGKPAADVAVDPRDGKLLVALPCDDALGRAPFDFAGGKDLLKVDVPKPYDLAVVDQDLVVIGTDGGVPLAGRAVSFDLSRAGFDNPQTKSFSLPSMTVWWTYEQSAGSLGVALELDRFTIYDVEVAPEGQRALCLFRGHFTSNMDMGTCAYATDVSTSGYMLVDLTAPSPPFSRLTSLTFKTCSWCNIPTQAGCIDFFRNLIRQANILAESEFEPSGATLLFGGT